MTDETNGETVPTRQRTPNEEFGRSGVSVRPGTDGIEEDGALKRGGDVGQASGGVAELLREVTRHVVDCHDREAVERTVCEWLGESSHYCSAWVGERAPASDRLTVRRTAGLDGFSPGEGAVGADDDAPPERRALERVLDAGTVAVLDEDGSEAEPWLVQAVEHDEVSAAAVPLTHDGSGYGVLAVATRRRDAFDEAEQHALDVLGDVVGATLSATRNRELLFADGVVELEVRVEDPRSFLVRTSDELDCRMSVEEHIEAGDRWLLYCDVEGTDAEVVATAVDQYPAVDHCRIIRNREGRRRLEITASGSSLLCEAAAAGARIRSAVADHGVCRADVEVAGSATVREIVARFRTTYPELELLSLREHDRPPADPHLSDGVLDDLTDRQRDALDAAYRAGYFEWPRESTAEEVAAGLDITGPTFLGHIRKAEKRVLSDLLGRPSTGGR